MVAQQAVAGSVHGNVSDESMSTSNSDDEGDHAYIKDAGESFVGITCMRPV
jgi:hypothetical protein